MKTKLIHKLILTSAVVAAAGWSGTSLANPVTSSFSASAEVIEACEIGAINALEFTDYNPVDGTATTGTTDIVVTCSNGMSGVTIALDAPATLESGANTLNFGLYSDAGHSTAWGSTVGTDTVAVTADGTAQTHTVHGQIDADQNTAQIGSYTGTVNVSVAW